ncbi:hypothetical protein PF002_g19737 [Phytophthora fragariae]|uniref:Uncharacterized protein n=1 Tax=Phytophthora fragariae TaxID=53985 RepID=A0A6A3XX80_9STRA|nr:hypothetical protein PF002_g19737 [Phytophthora fragariae]
MSSQPSCSQTTPSSATQSIRPVSIKQLQTLGGATGDDDALRLDGQEVLTVRLVELLSNLTPHSINLRSQLDDDGGQGRRRAAQGRVGVAGGGRARQHKQEGRGPRDHRFWACAGGSNGIAEDGRGEKLSLNALRQ